MANQGRRFIVSIKSDKLVLFLSSSVYFPPYERFHFQIV